MVDSINDTDEALLPALILLPSMPDLLALELGEKRHSIAEPA